MRARARAVLTLREGSALLRALVDSYVTCADDAESDELARRLRRLRALGDVDLGGRRCGLCPADRKKVPPLTWHDVVIPRG